MKLCLYWGWIWITAISQDLKRNEHIWFWRTSLWFFTRIDSKTNAATNVFTYSRKKLSQLERTKTKKIFEFPLLFSQKGSKSKCPIAFQLNANRSKVKQQKYFFGKLVWMPTVFLALRNNFVTPPCFSALCGGCLPVSLPDAVIPT